MKKLFSLALAAAMALSMLTGCGNSNNTNTNNDANSADTQGSQTSQTQQLSGVVNTNGSTSMEKVMQVLIEAFKEQQPNVTVNYTGSGSGAGVTSAIDGTADLGLASRALKSEEEEKGAQANIVALDGVAVVVNPDNAVDDLTVDQIAQIFKGEITNWKDVDGPDEEILLVSREAGSGTRGAFEEICKLTEKNADGNEVSLVDESKAIIADSTNAVSTTVSTKKNAIGYISLGSYDSSLVTALDVDSVACTQENIVAGTYSIARPFLLISGPATDDAAKAFLGYAMSAEGQAVVAEHKYIPVA